MSAAQMFPAFERFKYSFFEDPTSAQDALDTASLAALAGDERAQAEEMLIAFLPDSRAVIGLGVLRSKKAEPQLKKLFDAALKDHAAAMRDAQRLPGYNPLGLLFLAKALWLIDPDPRWQDAAIDVLASGYEWMHRQESAYALGVMHTPAATAALTKALDDPDEMVRNGASRALLGLYGVPTPVVPTPQDMTIRVMAKDPARHDAARRDILAAIAGRAMVGD